MHCAFALKLLIFLAKIFIFYKLSSGSMFFPLIGPGGLGRSTIGHRTVHVSTGHEDVDRNQSVVRAAKADVQKRRADQTGRPVHENSSSIVPQQIILQKKKFLPPPPLSSWLLRLLWFFWWRKDIIINLDSTSEPRHGCTRFSSLARKHVHFLSLG